MTKRETLPICLGLLFAAVTPLSAQSEVDSLRYQVRELERQVGDMARRQALSDTLLQRMARLLERNETAQPPVAGTAASPCHGRPSSNQWLQVTLRDCPTLSPNGEAITFTLVARNVTNETQYIGAQCCYPDNWLSVVDDRGQRWEGTQFSVTALPTSVSRHYAEVAPGAEVQIQAQVTYKPPSRTLAEIPGQINITLSLLRRTGAEQRVADRAATALGFPDGRPFTVGVTQVPVDNRPARN